MRKFLSQRTHLVALGALVLIAIVLLLTQLSCNRGNPVDDNKNPNIKPRVVSTYPPDGGVGPFSIYSIADELQYAHFYVRFNKLIQLATIQQRSVSCIGFNDKIVVSAPVYYSNSHDGKTADTVGFRLFLSTDSTFNYARYEAGQTYTVTLDTNIIDVDGHRLEKPYTFSFEPEPQFRVVRTSPRNGDTLRITTNNSITILFNSDIDTSILRFISISPPIGGRWTKNPYLPELDHSNVKLSTSTTYEMIISGNALDRTGHQLSAGFTTRFSTPRFGLIGNFTGNDSLQMDGALYFPFTTALDTTTVEGAFSINPSVPLFFIKTTSSFLVGHGDDFLPNSTYTYTVSTALHDIDGNPLPESIHGTTHTDVFRVTSFTGMATKDGFTHWRLSCFFQLSGTIDTTSFLSSFHSEPSIAGHFRLAKDFGSFTSDTTAPSNTLYRLMMDKSLKSAGGYELLRADTLLISTGSN